MGGKILIRWIILCICLAFLSAIFWFLGISETVNDLVGFSFLLFLATAFVLLFVDRR